MTKIGEYSFAYCSSLKTIIIGNGITEIQWRAFDGTTSITTVKINKETPLNISYAFDNGNCRNATLYVPVGSKAAYEAAYGWNEFKEIVETDNFETGVFQITDCENILNDIYDLKGVHLSEPKKGINIVNGKKYVIK